MLRDPSRREIRHLLYCEPDDPELLSIPTKYWAGSIEKIAAMRQRFERGEALFLPQDSKLVELPCLEAFESRLDASQS